MTNHKFPESALELRLRRLHGRLDTSPEFESKVLARVDGLRTLVDESARRALRARVDRERFQTEARLKQRFWRGLGIALLAGGVATLLASAFGAELGHVLASLGIQNSWNPIALGSLALLAAWLWIAVRGASAGESPRTVLG